MITENQIEKLKPLTEHPRFGKLLLNAIENWKLVKPNIGAFGIRPIYKKESDFFVWKEDNTNYGCCLIGSSLINITNKNAASQFDLCELKYNLTDSEVYGLIIGFDNIHIRNVEFDQKAYEFGKKVNEIIFKNDCN